MSDLEREKFRQIGIGLVNEYRQQRGFGPINWLAIDTPEASAFIRSIQLHEKTKKELQGVKQEFDDFKQKVSDAAVQAFPNTGLMPDCLGELIIPKPVRDPLEEVLQEIDHAAMRVDECAKEIRAALEARGLEIREKGQ